MKKNLLVLGMTLVALAFGLFGTGCSNPDANNAINEIASYTNEKADVYNFATSLVKKELDAPSTALFPTFSNSYVEEESAGDSEFDAVYVVNSSVECENMVGGRITLEYTVNVGVKHDEGKMYGKVVSLR